MSDLPNPFVQPEVDIRDFAFTPMFRARLFGSSFHARVSDSEWRAGVTLWLKSWDQVPAGSLPDDDVDLCRLAELGRDIKSWRKIRNGALHGWTKCSDGRLYHVVVAEGVNSAWRKCHSLRHAAIRKKTPKRIKGARWTKVRARILKRDGYTCQICGVAHKHMEVDHRHPIAEGGCHTDDNLWALCRPCNRRKSYHILEAKAE